MQNPAKYFRGGEEKKKHPGKDKRKALHPDEQYEEGKRFSSKFSGLGN